MSQAKSIRWAVILSFASLLLTVCTIRYFGYASKQAKFIKSPSPSVATEAVTKGNRCKQKSDIKNEQDIPPQ